MTDGRFTTDPAAGEYSVDPDNQLQPEDTLVDRGLDDMLDEGYSPPERPYGRGTLLEHETMDQRLAEEEPDSGPGIAPLADEDREWEFPRNDEVGRARAGRLVAPDLGFGEDTEAQCVAEDVGISGGAASAEEAAVHIIDNEA
ncbi:DUF5709 domain-containing protein [Mycolicibacterium sp. 120270]|uniref:DUF5709 domain-containing protein n=1 Tax=Mycolicibacterium sp. 120270 TaxID=3090600 RepID=UPI00299DC20E|nr:DUF5709 domain-containing protein [Mycolicibacterium sp. 120270]MDX1885984.1 DUF5709 domain-containing protein [Mycolicibacterium sp. 120270]